MVSTLTVSLEELFVDEYQADVLQATVQVQNKSVRFSAPFRNLVIKLASFVPDDFMYIMFSTKVEDIGQTQISLENLKESQTIEKSVQITKLSQSPEKNATKKILNIGKCKIRISCKDEQDESPNIESASTLSSLGEIKEIFQSFWEIPIPDSPDIESLGLAVINSERYLRKVDFDHLRVLATGLNEKIKLIPILQKQLEVSDELSNKYYAMYENLLAQLKIQREEFEQSSSAQSAENEKNLKELQSAMLENCELKKKNYESQCKADELQSTIEILNGEMTVLKSKVVGFEHLENLVRELKMQIDELEGCRNNLISELAQNRQETSKLTENFSSESESLMSTLEGQSSEIKSLSHNCEKQENLIEAQNNEILSLNLQIENYHKQIQAYSDLEETLQSSQKSYSALHNQYNALQEAYNSLTSQFSQDLSHLSEEKEKICELSRDIQQENMKLQSSILKFSSDLNQSKLSQSSLISELAVAQQYSKNSQDLDSLSNALSELQSSAEKISSGLYKELEFVSEYLLGQSEQNLLNVRAMNRVLAGNQDKENEILVLREMVSDLQRRRAVYFPHRDDVVDTAVADYINTRGTDVPFTREDHGIYVFGSKRVFVKLENGRIVSI